MPDVVAAGVVQPVLRAWAGPPFGWWNTRMRASSCASASQTAAEPSWLPSSTSSSSKSVNVWARMLSTAGRRYGPVL